MNFVILWDGSFEDMDINLKDSFRSILKKMPLTFWMGSKYRAWEQSRIIEKEQLYYEQKLLSLDSQGIFQSKKSSSRLRKSYRKGIFSLSKNLRKICILFLPVG